MPGFVSHTVMAHDIYNKIENKNISLRYLLTYSLGGDLCKYAKCRYDSHHINQDKFIYALADYIKENKLTNDNKCLSVLYAHICHYVMDDTIHPLVRKIDKVCINNKRNHALIEEYYDEYLVNKIFNSELKYYFRDRILSAKGNKLIYNMLDYAYYNIYNIKNIHKYYKFNLFLYRILSFLYRFIPVNKIIGLDRFLRINNDIDIVNSNHKISYKNYLKDNCRDSLMELYDECIDRTIKYIEKIDKYIYK